MIHVYTHDMLRAGEIPAQPRHILYAVLSRGMGSAWSLDGCPWEFVYDDEALRGLFILNEKPYALILLRRDWSSRAIVVEKTYREAERHLEHRLLAVLALITRRFDSEEP